MSSEGIQTTLFRALEKTRGAGGLEWKRSKAKSTRFFADLGEWRMRIESESIAGEHPFKFSVMLTARPREEVDSIRSIEADRQLTHDERKLNQALRELWEKARAGARGANCIGDLNELLNTIE